jgi:hypothetical protein
MMKLFFFFILLLLLYYYYEEKRTNLFFTLKSIHSQSIIISKSFIYMCKLNTGQTVANTISDIFSDPI